MAKIQDHDRTAIGQFCLNCGHMIYGNEPENFEGFCTVECREQYKGKGKMQFIPEKVDFDRVRA